MSKVQKKRSEAKLPNTLSEKGKQEVEQFGWPFFKAGVIAVNNDKYLLVKEAKVKQKQPDGSVEWVKSPDGKWNLPCGRLHQWENFWRGADREAREETACDFDYGCIRHIGFRLDIDNPYIIVIYHAEKPYDISLTDPIDPEEIAATGWFTYEEILELNEKGLLRNPELTLGAVNNERADFVIPDTAITVYEEKYSMD